jgi:hypothetical protein
MVHFKSVFKRSGVKEIFFRFEKEYHLKTFAESHSFQELTMLTNNQIELSHLENIRIFRVIFLI